MQYKKRHRTYGHSGNPPNEKLRLGQIEQLQQQQRKKVNSNVYAFIMLSVLVAFCGCASAVGPWIFTYVFINTVSVSFSRSIRNRLSFFAQTHHGTRLLCRQSPPSDGHTIQCVRAIHCSVTQHTKENMIIKNIFVVFFLLL